MTARAKPRLSSVATGALELRTRRLSLRPLTTADLDAAHRLWTDVEVRRHLWDDEIISRERAAEALRASEADFAERGFGLWGVYLLEAPTALAGFCGLRCSDIVAEPELLFGLLPAYWRRGLAAESATAVIRDAFGRLGLAVLEAAADAPNLRSIALLERLGFQRRRSAAVGGRETGFFELSRERWSERRAESWRS